MPATERIHSIDVLRGAVMVLMALDHVRVYSGVPAGSAEAAVFFTRWVTHFCAPAFAFFAGTSAYLYGTTVTRAALSRFLLVRGLLLIALELTVVKVSWTFNLDYSQFVLLGVIWMLGACMVAMALLVRLPVPVVGVFGVAMMAVHQVFGRVAGGWAWELVYPSGVETPRPLAVLYTLIPWLGMMAAGFAFGALLKGDPSQRRRWCLGIGLAATAAFAIATTIVTARSPAGELPPLLAALNQPKYPPSQLFLLMTLGPVIALMPLAERARGAIGRALEIYGRVPLFYYLCHIPLIHALALGVNAIRDGNIHSDWYATAPFVRLPPEDRWSLGVLYLVFAVAVAALYPLCRWFLSVKARHPSPWLRYL